MIEYRIAPFDLGVLLVMQNTLNNAYNGDVWSKDKDFIHGFSAAADVEMAEYLEEIGLIWKWYDPNARFDRQKALFEMVDVAHFMNAALLSAFIHGRPTEQLDSLYNKVRAVDIDIEEGWTITPYDFNIRPANGMATYGRIRNAYVNAWRGILALHYGSGLAIAVDTAVKGMIEFYAQAAGALGFTGEQFLQAYRMKNARNHQRVLNGVMRGVDVKQNEKELIL